MSKSESRKASKMVFFRATPEDHASLSEAAKSRGQSLSAFARRSAFKSADVAVPSYEKAVNEKLKDIGLLLGELGRIGNNLNQLARATNQNKSLPELEILRDHLYELRAIRSFYATEEGL